MKCLKCGSGNAEKYGFVRGKQRYRCRKCGYQFTRETGRGKQTELRRLAVVFYAVGVSRRKIAKILGVSPTTVNRWIGLYYSDWARENKTPFSLIKIQPEDILQPMILRGLPPREIKKEAYILSVTIPETGWHLDLAVSHD